MGKQVTAECDHGFPRTAEKCTPSIQHYVAHCSHIDNRFVVIIANPKTGNAFVDFVQLDPFLCESHYVKADKAADLFDVIDARLRAGEAPDPETKHYDCEL